VIADTEAFLRWFQGVNRRAMRDVAILPPEASAWRPPGGDGENAWTIGQIVGHMASSRLYFASAYRGEGWIANIWPAEMSDQAAWVPALEESGARLVAMLSGTPPEWLSRKLEPADGGESEIRVSGWRALMMMAEHDVHHRSQIDTIAGLNGWEVAQIFGRTAEQVAAQQAEQRRLHGRDQET
jgi:uncharacterized damage-inducible protein DinB